MIRILKQLRRRVRQLLRAVPAEKYAFWRRRPVRARTVLYESFAGNGMLCNPEALFRALLSAPDQADLLHIWVLDSPRRHPAITAEFATHPRVRFVRYRSSAYFRALATSGYLINNATFPAEFSKRPGQTYLNTWHGTPLKQMGYDMPGGAIEAANTLRNFVAADFLLAANAFMAEQMYEKAYRLRGAYRGLIVEEGYPRIDRQFLTEDQQRRGREQLAASGIELGDLDTGGREIVLYAPTWKGDSFSTPDDDVLQLVEAVSEMQSLLGERYVVLLKTHQIVHRFAAHNAELRRILVSNEIPSNVVLGLSAVLITDYSSIFIDYLPLSRPIVFLAPDLDDYTRTRGLYFEPEEWPGAVCTTPAEVTAAILAPLDMPESVAVTARASTWRDRLAAHETGSSARRVIDVVFRGQRSGYRVRPSSPDARPSVLLFIGGMLPNGITASAVNLLNSIDHTALDVSVQFAYPRGAAQLANQALINPAVRQFMRVGGMNGSKLTHLRRKLAARRGDADIHRTNRAQSALWDDEWTRCFGDVRFDAVIDFSGYGPFWSTLLLHSPPAVRSIWLHNDMAAEVHRRVNGRESMKLTLPEVFALYPEFDRIVSVSPGLTELNRRELSSYCTARPEQFVTAPNLIDARRVAASAAVSLRSLNEYRTEIDSTADGTIDSTVDNTATGEPEWVTQLLADNDTVWFVTVGRFSPEKNQARLLRAFAQVHARMPQARLTIVGYGPLRADLEQLVDTLGVRGAAFIVGPFANPFPILAASDCFVLSSDYEGQPMVILEAATLGLPIVTVDFRSVHDALPNHALHIVAQDDDALAQGMLEFMTGSVPAGTLDTTGYNAAALAGFLRATSLATGEMTRNS
ncbi:hypothetical protein GCM10022381_39500 [Leifsonia kafniensis]|uniref:Glycosyl transferase family 1 domain-containing protein n=1 Tax=Leifsonia kafniensis TaxID=475957 RepID=A0ABP7L2P1_9MICO